MSMEQAILEHASALRELAAAIQSMGVRGAISTIAAATPGQILDAVKPDAEMEEAVTRVEKTAKAEKKESVVKEMTIAELANTPIEETITTEDKVLDYKADVVPALLALQKKTGGLKDLLTKFGVTKGDQLKAEQYADIVAQANKLAA